MLYLIVFILLQILILTVLFLIKAGIQLEYVRIDRDDRLLVSFFTLGGLVKYEYEVPLIDIDKTGLKIRKLRKKEQEEKIVDRDKEFIRLFEFFDKIKSLRKFNRENRIVIYKIKKYIKEKFILKEYRFEASLGTGDPYYTGIFSGVLWTFAGLITSYLLNNFKAEKKCINIKSDFTGKKFNIGLHCIFITKIVYIIVVILKLLFYNWNKKFKLKKVIGGGILG